jgi:hypothetical protein
MFDHATHRDACIAAKSPRVPERAGFVLLIGTSAVPRFAQNTSSTDSHSLERLRM